MAPRKKSEPDVMRVRCLTRAIHTTEGKLRPGEDALLPADEAAPHIKAGFIKEIEADG